jgi:uncharacterized protein
VISSWQPVFDKALPPIYRQDQPERSLFYAPGWLVVVPPALAAEFAAEANDPARARWPEAVELRNRAVAAQKTWEGLQTSAFAPVCLTLYLNNDCNLKCVYCFSKPYRRRGSRLSLEAIRLAAEIVAENCRVQQRPFTVAFHGGGEPTLDHDLISQSAEALEEIADRYNLDLFRYIATNGILSRARASRLARDFDLIGLSCDGPPDIQNRQRPFQKENQHVSSWFVKQAAQAVHEAGKPLHVRVTITPETMDRQAEIADYVCQTLKPLEIRVEPVYAVEGNETEKGFHLEQAGRYVSAFLCARGIAREYGVDWLASGSRPAEIHSAYCNVWRNVLNLTPEGIATNCFKLSEADSVHDQHLELGEWDARAGRFILNTERIHDLRQALQTEPEECTLCFNRYHCAHQCPDVCLLKSGVESSGFRCRVQSMLSDALIQETAEALCLNTNVSHPIIGKIPEHH